MHKVETVEKPTSAGRLEKPELADVVQTSSARGNTQAKSDADDVGDFVTPRAKAARYREMLRAAAKARDKETYTALMALSQREIMGGRFSLVVQAPLKQTKCDLRDLWSRF